MISYSGLLVQSCCGEGGALRTDICVWGALTAFRPHWVCPVQGCLCFPRLHCSGSRLLYMERALRCLQFQFSGTPQKRRFGCACVLCLPRPERLWQPGAWAPSPLRGPSLNFLAFGSSLVPAACVCSQELDSSRDPPGGGCRPSRISGSLWLETGGLFAVLEGMPSLGLSLPLSPLFCERPAVCSSRLIFSLAMPQFKKAPSDCSQGL